MKTVVFVSKAAAQKKMEKEFRSCTRRRCRPNPLPDSWVVTPTKGEYTPQLGAQIQRANYAGVETCALGA